VAAVSGELPPRFAAVPWVAALGALRKGEIFGLARMHVDVESGVIRVERALQEQTGNGVVLKAPKTASSVRTVGMPNRLADIMATHLDTWVESEPHALVFTNDYGRPVRATVWSAAWTTARDRAGLPGLRLHDLRHLAGTLTAQSGATTKETMDRLGHSSAAAALRYQHVVEQRRQQVAEGIDRLLGSSGGQRSELGIRDAVS
jgi:integrase